MAYLMAPTRPHLLKPTLGFVGADRCPAGMAGGAAGTQMRCPSIKLLPSEPLVA